MNPEVPGVNELSLEKAEYFVAEPLYMRVPNPS